MRRRLQHYEYRFANVDSGIGMAVESVAAQIFGRRFDRALGIRAK
jgi:hypothetical protein